MQRLEVNKTATTTTTTITTNSAHMSGATATATAAAAVGAIEVWTDNLCRPLPSHNKFITKITNNSNNNKGEFMQKSIVEEGLPQSNNKKNNSLTLGV